MGKYDREIAHYIKQRHLDHEALDQITDGITRYHSRTGPGPLVDETEAIAERLRRQIAQSDELVALYEKLNALEAGS